MVCEIITLHIGQCGNQIAPAFWELASLDTLQVKNTQFVTNDGILGDSPFYSNYKGNLKPRAILIDMEETVIDTTLRSINIDKRQIIQGTGGSGNNWAKAFAEHSREYHERLHDCVRFSLEDCESPQAVLMFHSIAGGTGSGVGSYIQCLLEDDFPDLLRFSVSVCPDKENDVISSPYNSVLTAACLLDYANCVFPITNGSLFSRPPSQNNISKKPGQEYRSVNDYIAHLALSVTAGMRLPGELNVDLTEISMNLIPYPKTQFILSSMATPSCISTLPQVNNTVARSANPNDLNRLFRELHSSYNFNIPIPHPEDSRAGNFFPLSHYTTLALAYFLRGEHISSATAITAANKAVNNLAIPSNYQRLLKIGLCNEPPLSGYSVAGQPATAVALANSTAVCPYFHMLLKKFKSLFKVKAHLHHYLEFIEYDCILKAEETLASFCGSSMQISPTYDDCYQEKSFCSDANWIENHCALTKSRLNSSEIDPRILNYLNGSTNQKLI